MEIINYNQSANRRANIRCTRSLNNFLIQRERAENSLANKEFFTRLPKLQRCFRSGDSSFLWLLGLDINSVKKPVKKAIK